MKTYKIFTSPLGQTEAVKQGWSWPGFFFCIFWTLAKKMWMTSVLIVVGGFVWDFLADIFASEVKPFGMAFMALVGAQGNTWRENNLRRRGYEHQETVQALTPEAALALWTKGVSKDISGEDKREQQEEGTREKSKGDQI